MFRHVASNIQSRIASQLWKPGLNWDQQKDAKKVFFLLDAILRHLSSLL